MTRLGGTLAPVEVMTVQVTKLEANKEIAAKEFDVHRDFDLKPMKEMQSMLRGQGPGNFEIRRQVN